MKTELKEIKLFQESVYCECGGEYKTTGFVQQVNGIVSCPHICDKCGNQVLLTEQYPKITQKVLDVVKGEYEIIKQEGDKENEEN